MQRKKTEYASYPKYDLGMEVVYVLHRNWIAERILKIYKKNSKLHIGVHKMYVKNEKESEYEQLFGNTYHNYLETVMLVSQKTLHLPE